MSEKAVKARSLLNHQNVGVLSTHSVDVPGYPFGSITPYVVDYRGEPVILISEIAQHTRNIKHNRKVSLTIFEQGLADPQASGRLTWMGDAAPVVSAEREIHHRYLRYFPAAESYFETHDFSLYVIHLKRARFIGGFGQIHWVEPVEMLIENPFQRSEQEIVDHMNQDHQQALFHYCRTIKGVTVETVAMTGLDREGFDLLADGRKLRIDFEAPIDSVAEARAALVKLARS